MRSRFLFCTRTNQPRDMCFCESCILEDSEHPPQWTQEPTDVETDNATLTVSYVREQIKLMTETVKKANRTIVMAERKKSTAKDKPQNGIPRLELKDLTTDKKRLKILWAGDPTEVGVNADWAVSSVKFISVATGQKRIYTMGDNNPSLDCLEDGFGRETKQWIDREVFAWKAVVGVQEKEFIRFGCIGGDGQEIPFDYDRADTASGAAAGSEL